MAAEAIVVADRWLPTIPPYQEQEISIESQGWKARLLWEQRMAEFAEIARESSGYLPTGIGGGVAGHINGRGMSRFGDGSKVYPFCNLKERFNGSVPKVLFAPASTFTSDDLINLLSAAEAYHEQGVLAFVPILSGIPHERQDHIFFDEDGKPINQLTTLKGVMIALKGAYELGLIPGAVGVGMHSLRPTELAARYGFPLIPASGFDYMVQNVGFGEKREGIALGADKGRKGEAKKLAGCLSWPYVVAKKTRDRLYDNEPTVEIPEEALSYMKEHGCEVDIYEDEVREGGTLGATRRALDGFARSLKIIVPKGIFAADIYGVTAAQRLSRPLEHGFEKEIIYVSDAVQPLTSIKPIQDRLVVVSYEPGFRQLSFYLSQHLVEPENPLWLNNKNETLLHLDLTHETYEETVPVSD